MKQLKDSIIENIDQEINQDINEFKLEPIDDQWINDENPVMTKDGRKVYITSVDLSVVPNIIHGNVIMGKNIFAFSWEDDGTCISAQDKLGNPIKPSENDQLVKAK